MSISGITLMKGATGISVTGGTGTVHSADGLEVKSGIHVVDTTEANFILRPHGTFKNKPAARQQDGTWSKGIRNFNYTIPFLETDGSVSYPVFKGELNLPINMSVAMILQLRLMAAQSIMDSELDNYYNLGTIV
jgi:hypothetical protein